MLDPIHCNRRYNTAFILFFAYGFVNKLSKIFGIVLVCNTLVSVIICHQLTFKSIVIVMIFNVCLLVTVCSVSSQHCLV